MAPSKSDANVRKLRVLAFADAQDAMHKIAGDAAVRQYVPAVDDGAVNLVAFDSHNQAVGLARFSAYDVGPDHPDLPAVRPGQWIDLAIIAVPGAEQGSGIRRLLFGAVRDLAASQGRRCINTARHDPSLGFWLSLGFRQQGPDHDRRMIFRPPDR